MHVASLTVYMDNISPATEHSAHLPCGSLMDHIILLPFLFLYQYCGWGIFTFSAGILHQIYFLNNTREEMRNGCR